MDTYVNAANQDGSVGADIAFDAVHNFFACLVRCESSSVPTTLPTAYDVYPLDCLQAEDDIRDFKVTGVQTCALPILAGLPGVHRHRPPRAFGGGAGVEGADLQLAARRLPALHADARAAWVPAQLGLRPGLGTVPPRAAGDAVHLERERVPPRPLPPQALGQNSRCNSWKWTWRSSPAVTSTP